MSFTPNEAQQPVTEEEGWRDGPSRVGTCTHGWLTTTQFLSSVFVVENAANVPDRQTNSFTYYTARDLHEKRGEMIFPSIEYYNP